MKLLSRERELLQMNAQRPERSYKIVECKQELDYIRFEYIELECEEPNRQDQENSGDA